MKSAAALLNRIGEIAHELQNHSLADVVVGPQVTRLERYVVVALGRIIGTDDFLQSSRENSHAPRAAEKSLAAHGVRSGTARRRPHTGLHV